MYRNSAKICAVAELVKVGNSGDFDRVSHNMTASIRVRKLHFKCSQSDVADLFLYGSV